MPQFRGAGSELILPCWDDQVLIRWTAKYLPSGELTVCYWKWPLKMAIEIVDFPMKNGDFPWQNVSSPGRVVHSTKKPWLRKQWSKLSQLHLVLSSCSTFMVHRFQGTIGACIGIPTCGIYLKRYLDIGIFHGRWPCAFEELKAGGTMSSTAVRICWWLPIETVAWRGSAMKNASDGMYMHLLIGRYTYRTLTLESDFNKRVSTVLAQYKIDLLGKPTEIEFDKEVYPLVI